MRCIGMVVVALAVVTSDLGAQDDRLYWTDSQFLMLRRAAYDGGCDVEIVNSLQDPGWGVDVDPRTGEVYCADPGFGPDRVLRIDADGRSVEVLWSQDGAVTGDLQLDTAAGKIYWVDTLTGVLRSNLDGSAVELVVDGASFDAPGEIAIDAEAGAIYWTEQNLGEIRRAGLDGSGDVVVIATGLDEPFGLALDPATGLLYASVDAGIVRVGERVEMVVEDFGIWGVDLDATAGKIYWADSADFLARANLDGTEVETLAGGPLALVVAVDELAGRVYWASPGFDCCIGEGVFVYDVAADVLSSFFTTAIRNPISMAIDPLTEQMFWTNPEHGVMRSGLNGSNPHLIHALPYGEVVFGVAVDPAAGRVYWTDRDSIRRSDLDGGDVEEVYAQPDANHRDIEVDPDAGKMYWNDISADAILRANLDGTGVETLVVSAGQPRSLALDLDHGRIYWTEASGDVRRATLDGRLVETIASTDESGRGIAVDPPAGLVFWATSSLLYRANLDGSEMEPLFVFAGSIADVAIGPFDPLADVNGDGIVDVADLIALIIGWGSDDPALDIDGDGIVGASDLLELLSRWGECA